MKRQKDKDQLGKKDIIMAIFIIVLLILVVVIEAHKIGKLENNNIQIPTNLGATYYTPSGIYVRFDSTDQNQVALVKQIEMICKLNHFRNCMNAADALGVNPNDK